MLGSSSTTRIEITLVIRQRKFYCTRHTWFSLALSSGIIPLKLISEQGGTSLAMLEQNYGKFLDSGGSNALRALYSGNHDFGMTYGDKASRKSK